MHRTLTVEEHSALLDTIIEQSVISNEHAAARCDAHHYLERANEALDEGNLTMVRHYLSRALERTSLPSIEGRVPAPSLAGTAGCFD